MFKEKFLLYMLAGIFTFQAGLFGAATVFCMNNGGREVCPDLGSRYEKTFTVMIATTLALLSGAALKK